MGLAGSWFQMSGRETDSDRVDDEAEDVELYHTSCVSPFAHHNDNLNQQTFKSISWKQ